MLESSNKLANVGKAVVSQVGRVGGNCTHMTAVWRHAAHRHRGYSRTTSTTLFSKKKYYNAEFVAKWIQFIKLY